MPLYATDSQTSNRPDLSMFQSLVQPIFPSARVLDYETRNGSIFPLCLLKLSNGLELTLKGSARQSTTLLRHEKHSLQTEAAVLSLLAPRNNPFIPRLFAFDVLKFPPRTPFLLKQSLRGVPLSEVEPSSITSADSNRIDEQLGRTVKLLGQFTSTQFGCVHAVARGEGRRSWKHAFMGFIESILCDAEDMFISLPYAEIRHHAARLSPALDGVTEARLVVVNLGDRSNVLVDRHSKQVTGFDDFSVAVWGDVLMAEVFQDPSPALLNGYGSSQMQMDDESLRIRLILYSCYRHICRIVKQYYRTRQDDEEMLGRRGLTAILADIAAMDCYFIRAITMSHFLRGKQAGINADLSAGLAPEHFMLDDVARYGINSRISALAYDPVQSLLAVGTSETQYGSGQIYIFGQERVSAVFTLSRKASVNILQFCVDKIISVDSKNEICVFSLEKRTRLAAYTPPGHVTALLTDPSLEYAFIGLQSGELVTYDLDRLMIAPFKLPNLWKGRNPRARILPIVSLAFHPRDIGKLLIGYLEGAVTFSIKMNTPTKYFQYEVPPGAPGGDSDPSSAREVRRPRLTKAIWHPTGTFILTAHDDSSLVFWDPKDGRVVMARTLADVDVNNPGAARSASSPAGTFSLKEPIFQVAWCCKENPDDTGLLIAGGAPTTELNKSLTFFDLGPTPNYQTSSWQVLANHLAQPRNINKLPTPPNVEVVDFVLIPRSSPFFANAQDPIAVITLLSSGEMVTLSFPSGHPISPTNMLHLSLSFVHPFVNKIALAYVDRTRWLGWREKRAQGPNIVIGGAAAKKPMKRFENRDIAQTAHADGIIRMWDTGHDDHIENPLVIQVDLARAVGRFDSVEVSAMSLAGAAGEFSAGLKTGEVVIFKWGRNPNVGRDLPLGQNDGPGRLFDISRRADPGLKEGFIPLVLLNQQQGPVTALENSDVGFVCVGFQSGSLAIIDLRGPAVIHTCHVSDFVKHHRRMSIRKNHKSSSAEAPPEWPTCIKFAVLSLEGEDYSSIICLVGTSRGNLATFKILPSSGGTFTASFVGSRNVDDKVLSICPIDAETGNAALASQTAVSNLRNGYKINGVVIAVTPSGCRMFKPATAKGADKDWDDFLCDYATVVKAEDRATLVGVFGDGRARAYSIPALKEISSVPIDNILEMRRLGEAVISPSGDVIGWTGPSELAMLSLWGAGLPLRRLDDAIYNPGLSVPPRPTISNLQWISGTQYVTPADMDLLIGGPDRPPSKHMIEQMRQDEMSRQSAQRGQSRAARNQPQPQGSEEGYWSYMQRQVQQRTENLNLMGDSMDRLEERSSGWADDVNKYVKNQKKKAVLGALGSKFGF
ncbi:hypothetical protein AJ79_00745 [Helicocarpus griseus UAMH5409]|uniref:Lethal giant larvae (Lgl)-like C-terminal domain-containing protein n=1 Tax=Helicocarpus griseus UAMH5409 TaxID=1447875 RepID=A0A2B7YBZ8_9EURO|nr:hypothetical protein AJ79_00745 [Helicocarpus griseus UAMH5409]